MSAISTFQFAFAGLLLAVGSGTLAQPARPPTGRTPAARVERRVPFAVGEALTYDVSWSNFLTAGTAVLTVREKRPSFGSVAYHIVAEGQAGQLLSRIYQVSYRAETLLDTYTLLPQQGLMHSQEGNRTKTQTTRFDQTARTATFEQQPPSGPKRQLKLRGDTHDPISAFFIVRTQALKRGASFTIPVANGGETFNVRMTVGDREQVPSPNGVVAAWKLTPTVLDDSGRPVNDYKLALWLSDDDRRLPLKLEADLGLGAFVFTLRGAAVK